MNLEFGLNDAVPVGVGTAWGARLIFPNQLLWDRQDMAGGEREPLTYWLNSGALRKALEQAQTLATRRKITPDGTQTVVLHRDAQGVVVASPRSSFGYLYAAAWLHEGDPERQPHPEYAPQ